MRHGEADSYQVSDYTRALTSFGVEQSTKAATQLKKLFATKGLPTSIDRVLVSPYLRTQQTYEAAKQQLDIKTKIDTDAIVPMGDVASVKDIIDGYAMSNDEVAGESENLMFISHMPLVSLLADAMCSGFNGKIFDTADILIIEYDHKAMTGKQLALIESRK